eukprot:1137066-Pelagomonas_calceolata.AAC.10
MAGLCGSVHRPRRFAWARAHHQVGLASHFYDVSAHRNCHAAQSLTFKTATFPVFVERWFGMYAWPPRWRRHPDTPACLRLPFAQYEFPSTWPSFFEDLIRVMLPGCCAAVTPGGPMVLGPVAQVCVCMYV